MWWTVAWACVGAPPEPAPPEGEVPAIVAPFTLRPAGGEMRVLHQGVEVARFGSIGDATDRFTPLHVFAGFEDVWLVEEYQGDGCPVAYRALCLVGGRFVATESFGNCNAFDQVAVDDLALVFAFPGWDVAMRSPATVRLDSECRTTVR